MHPLHASTLTNPALLGFNDDSVPSVPDPDRKRHIKQAGHESITEEARRPRHPRWNARNQQGRGDLGKGTTVDETSLVYKGQQLQAQSRVLFDKSCPHDKMKTGESDRRKPTQAQQEARKRRFYELYLFPNLFNRPSFLTSVINQQLAVGHSHPLLRAPLGCGTFISLFVHQLHTLRLSTSSHGRLDVSQPDGHERDPGGSVPKVRSSIVVLVFSWQCHGTFWHFWFLFFFSFLPLCPFEGQMALTGHLTEIGLSLLHRQPRLPFFFFWSHFHGSPISIPHHCNSSRQSELR